MTDRASASDKEVDPEDESHSAESTAGGDDVEGEAHEPSRVDDESEDDESEDDESEDDDEGEAKASVAPKGKSKAAAPKPSLGFLAAVSLTSLVLDFGSKWWAIANLENAPPGQGRVTIIENFMQFVFARNKGGAWGVLGDQEEWLRLPFFFVISAAAVVFIFSLYRRLAPNQTALKWGLPLVLGGALGNLVDRVRFGYVVDFIDVFVEMDGQQKHWPTFNVADIAIVAGVLLMAVDMFTPRKEAKKVDRAKKAIEDEEEPALARRKRARRHDDADIDEEVSESVVAETQAKP